MNPALRVVLDVLETDELQELREENWKLREMRAALKQLLKTHDDKYFDLVWLARKRLDEPPHIQQIIDMKIAKYPTEFKELSCPNTGFWAHGFNSGMLAACRLYHEFTEISERVYDEDDVDHLCAYHDDHDPDKDIAECPCELCRLVRLHPDHCRIVEGEGGGMVYQNFQSVKAIREGAVDEFPSLDT